MPKMSAVAIQTLGTLIWRARPLMWADHLTIARRCSQWLSSTWAPPSQRRGLAAPAPEGFEPGVRTGGIGGKANHQSIVALAFGLLGVFHLVKT